SSCRSRRFPAASSSSDGSSTGSSPTRSAPCRWSSGSRRRRSRRRLRVRAGRAAVAAFLGVTSLAAAASPPTLVFIHGIKGARLATDAGRVHWLTVAQALGLSTPVLALPTRFGDGGQERDALHPAGVLTTLILVPRLVEIDVYGRWLAAARALGRPFAPFAYDWRRDD